MLTIAVIHWDEAIPVFTKEIQGKLGDYQELVGGYINFTDLDDVPASIISNDEGLLERLEYNPRATQFCTSTLRVTLAGPSWLAPA